MLGVLYGCITQQHDIRLVLLAGFVCIFGCFTAVNLLVRAREVIERRQFALMSAAAGVFGAGVWTAHFIAELAFEPGLPVAYNTNLTALSLATAISLTWLVTLIALRYQKPIKENFSGS